ncbi:Piwi domain-containing protein [Geopyxis carbonaria]|nr:Piwi domain-containing protein [Geopyxis carbonaria]
MDPEVKNKRKRRRLFDILETHPGFSEYAKKTASDYGKMIVSMIPLNPKAGAGSDGLKIDRLEITVIYTERDDAPVIEEDRNKYKFIIQRVANVHPQDLDEYVAGNIPDYNPDQAIQALNIILAKFPSRSGTMVAVGKKKFFVLSDDAGLQYPLGAGLIALKGFYTSVRPSVGNMLCNLNVCTTAFYKEGSLARIIREFLGIGHGGYHPKMHGKLKSYLRHLRVTICYLENSKGEKKPRGRTITAVSHETPNRMKFEIDDPNRGTKTTKTVEQYFFEKHKIRLQDPDLPAINIAGPGAPNPVWIPAEMATVTKGQAFMGKLPDEQTAQMINFACKQPKENAEVIEKVGLPRLGLKGQNNDLNPFKMSVSNEMMVVPARVLPAPEVYYNKTSFTPTDASWNLFKRRFVKAASMPLWSYVVIQEPGRPINMQEVITILRNFKQNCGQCGMNVADPVTKFSDGMSPVVVTLPDFNKRDPDALEKAMRPAFKKLMDMKIPVAYVFLPSADKGVYAAVKYCGDTKAGIHTVCSQWSKVSKEKGQPQYLANEALKFNMKLGGWNHMLGTKQLGPLGVGRTMIVGCDVTHPSPGSLKGTPSIAGVVASIDDNFIQYPASLRLQNSRQEMIEELESMMLERLQLYATRNKGALPERIIMYRDGVSEGQFQHVLDQELPKLRAACSKVPMKQPYRPKISIIIVGKRHHTRFYPTSEDAMDRKTGNPQPGTVVDRGVTAVYDFDFYLQAHAGIKGTARPAHYYVIHDSNGFKADGLQQVTHNLCYLFSRATKSVSICPPAYYADLACERGRCYIYGLLNASDDVSSKSGGSEAQEIENTVRAARKLWDTGVHSRLKDTMFYL